VYWESLGTLLAMNAKQLGMLFILLHQHT